MKIVHIATKADVGGAQTYVLELATAQRSAGDDVVIVTGTPGPAATAATERGIRVLVEPSLVHRPSPRADARAYRSLLATLRSEQPDLVHLHSSKAGLLGRFAAWRAGVPCVYTAHGWPFQRGAPVVQRLMSWFGESVAGHAWGHVICLTDAEAALASRARVVPRARLHVVANGLPDIDDSRRADLRDRADDTPCHMVMVARFAAPKDQLGVVEALAALPATGWRFTFVGDGPDLAAAQRAAAAGGLDDRVTFAGHRDDVQQLLAEVDVFVLWSRYEGMPLALLEAMRAGLACVANELPGVAELLGGGAGVITPHDPPALASALTALVVDPARRARLGELARQRFEQRFTLACSMAGLDDVYASALAVNVGRRRAPRRARRS